MADCKLTSFAAQIQLLAETQPEFPQGFKQHLVFKAYKVANPFEFIGRLISKGVLCDGLNDSDASFGLKEAMVQFALVIACSKGATAMDGLMKSLEDSGNSELISELRTFVKEDFGIDTDYGYASEPKRDNSTMRTATLEMSQQVNYADELSSSGTKMIDNITTHLEDDFMEQLRGHLVDMAPTIINYFIHYLR